MKKWVCLALTLLFSLSAACAEIREAVIFLEGDEEEITETRFDGEAFTFWYDAEVFEADASRSESGSSVILEAKGFDEPVYMEIMGPDAVDLTAQMYLEANAGPETEYDWGETENGAELVGFQTEGGEDGELLLGYYTVESKDDYAAIYTVCPIYLFESVGTYMRRVMETISFGVLPVRAAYIQDADLRDGGYDTFVADEDYEPVEVVFFASRPVRNFKVLSLSMEDSEGDDLFAATELYARDSLTPDRPLVVAMVFYGDIPNNGISFEDENGVTHRCAVDINGEDGSLILWEF